ncbi:MAG: hypothetical protein J1G30_09915 [Spirochaetales bacterium]|nr:hypothetical protein [Spirochaetales bacterium]
MEAITSLQNADSSINKLLAESRNSVPFANEKIEKKVQSLTFAIKDTFKIDYSRPVAFKLGEKERVQRIYIDYLTGKADDFNSHYIQLLAWHLHELKIMSKNGNTLSVFEYPPFPLTPFTVVEKTFRLFHKKRIDVNKVSYALILNYLDNYKSASNRYKRVLRIYLKSIKFSDELDVYFFDANKVQAYVANKTAKTAPLTELYPERLSRLKIRPITLNTAYFTDAWFEWAINTSFLNIIKNLNCSYFKNCNEYKQRMVLVKMIADGIYSLTETKLESVCTKYIFPLINGNPFKKEFWDLNYTSIYRNYLERTWNFIEHNFVQNPKYEKMIAEYEKN